MVPQNVQFNYKVDELPWWSFLGHVGQLPGDRFHGKDLRLPGGKEVTSISTLSIKNKSSSSLTPLKFVCNGVNGSRGNDVGGWNALSGGLGGSDGGDNLR